MELRHVRALVAVAEHQHFSRAAESLHVSQPPLSAAIKELEHELGLTLFERTTRSVRLTDGGRAVLEPARRALREFARIRQVADEVRGGSAGTVRAGFAGTSGYAVLADLVRAVREREPRLHIELVPRVYSGEALELVRGGELDVAITGNPPAAELDALMLTEEVLVLAVPDGHRLAARASVTPHDLADEPLVSYPGEQESWVRQVTVTMLERAGVSPRVVAEAPDPFSLMALVAAGVGIGVVVDHRGKIHVDGVHYVSFADPAGASFPLRMAWHASAASPATQRVVQIARDLFTPD